eukprot:CAMPEP_0197443374 /NCGR_PEP_ID=MMETSP1175-20131217/9119_1 /TAXON_ID=1003142 /ORGANISM="Triceratium dubium, Strain CCMP147" /LENGTH=51 /DNA_ID=CAMNT_0042973991 /DNA_START=551 /DNA_END=702 /DNA_ORIENTATION=+
MTLPSLTRTRKRHREADARQGMGPGHRVAPFTHCPTLAMPGTTWRAWKVAL